MSTICQDLYTLGRGMFYKNVGFYLEGVWLWRISEGYSQEMIRLTLLENMLIVKIKTEDCLLK